MVDLGSYVEVVVYLIGQSINDTFEGRESDEHHTRHQFAR